MKCRQDYIDKIAELEQWLQDRPSASMDPFIEKWKDVCSEISHLRSELHSIAYNGMPSPMMQAQMNAAESLINKENEKAF
mgnify:CR=1 FL=1